MNPADIGSRGCTAQELIDSSLWWHGPPFLIVPRSKWPVKNIIPSQNDVTLIVRESPIPRTTTTPFKLEDYSTWSRLLHTTRSVLSFATRTNVRLHEKFGNSKVDLIKWSKIVLFRLAQHQFPPTETTQALLHLVMDPATDLWMRQTRTGINLVYLPRESRITLLYVLHLHTGIAHAGMDHTLLKVRETAWIPKGRSTIKGVINTSCPQCSRSKARPYTLPPFPQHPNFRTTPPLHPFGQIGMDMAGPLYYRSASQGKDKYWIFLITCLHSRSIHLDIVTDLTTKTLLNCIRRFVSVYGSPKSILADNFKSHVALDECFKAILDTSSDSTIVDYCASHGIDFRFITPGAPWEGGLYERMIGIVKKSLQATIGRSTYSLDDTVTIVKEIEAIVNTRPLSYVSSEGEISPLRPVDFTRPYAKMSLPRLRGEKDPDDDWNPIKTSKELLESSWKSTLQCVDDFWKRWSSEYRSALNERYKEHHANPRSITTSKPQLGDVVLIQDDNLDRGQWRLGQLIGSKDDFLRSAIVRLATGGSISRPFNKLHKIEIPSEKADPPDPPKKKEPVVQSRHQMVTRSRVNTTALTLMMLACLIGSTIATKCPSTTSDFSVANVVHATQCIKEGISCMSGATSTLQCRTRFHDLNIPITCNNKARGIIRCSPLGVSTDIVFNEDQPTVDLNCTAGPEGDNVTFKIMGQLFYAPSVSLIDVYNSSSYSFVAPSDPHPLSNLFDSISSLFSPFSFLLHSFYFPVILISVIIIFVALIIRNRCYLAPSKIE